MFSAGQMLTPRSLGQGMRNDESDESKKHVEARMGVDLYHKSRESWLQFCLFPDLHEPRRMPSMFPTPTHIVRRQRVVTTSINTAGNTLYMLWQPESLYMGDGTGTVAIDPAITMEGFRMCLNTYEAGTGVTPSNLDNANNIVGSSFYGAPPIAAIAPGGVGAFTKTSLAYGGVRLIGAFCEIEYVGTLENHSGMIECGLRLHNANTLFEASRVQYLDSTEVIQAPFYRKFKPMDGCRVVWFPIDNQDFEFQDYSTDYQSRLLIRDDGAPITAGNLASTTMQQYSQAYGSLKKNTRPEWGINISGLQVGQAVRIHMCAYYETIPEDSVRDLYMPRKTQEYCDPAKAKAAMTALVNEGVAATPAKTSSSWSGIASAIGKMVDAASSSYGLGTLGAGLSGYASGGIPGMILSAGSKMLEDCSSPGGFLGGINKWG